ncbi:MAG: biotin/lipoate A/B protein ligase family protein [Candidatus Thorarchaeota archaeon]
MFKGRIIDHLSEQFNLHFNLALEHAILSLHEKRTYIATLRLWKNDKAVILGRNQDLNIEINRTFCNTNDIAFGRRISGGGAVYQDYGNINISFFVNKKIIPSRFKNIKSRTLFFTRLFTNSLEYSGINNLHVVNDSSIFLKDKKISGSAGYTRGDWILHHATLLFSTNLDNLQNSLKAREIYPARKGRQSRYSPTTNLLKSFNVEIWKENLFKISSEKLQTQFSVQFLDNEEIEKAKILEKTIYSTKKWIFDGYRSE